MKILQRCKDHWPVMMIFIIPAIGISASLIAVSQAVTQPPQMVRGEYQRLGKALVDSLDAETQAAQLGLEARLDWQDNALNVQLQPRDAMALPARLRLNLAHPADSDLDVDIWLERTNGADYQAVVAVPKPSFQGALLLEPESLEWRLHGRLASADTAHMNAGVSLD
jgi:hypothetical protein